MEQHTPNKLQKPEQRQHINLYPDSGFTTVSTHPIYQLAPLPASGWNNQYSMLAPILLNINLLLHLSHHIHSLQTLCSNTLPLRTSGRSLSPPSCKNCHISRKLQCPCYPSPSAFPCSPYQQQLPTPWIPHQPALDWLYSRGNNTVPLYELPPPDLIEYGMVSMIAIRMLPEWNKNKEHWHCESQPGEDSALRQELGEDGDYCTVM